MIAIWWMAAILFQNGSAQEAYRRAVALLEQHDAKKAEAAAEEALRLNPRLVPALTLKARLAMADSRMDEAQRALESAISIDPGAANARFLLGMLFYMENHFDRAREALSKANSNDPRVALYLALSEEGLNHNGEAAAQYERAVTLDKTTPEPRVAYARLLFREGKAERAEKLVDEALKLAPMNPDALFEKGRFLFERGQYADAASFGERALQTEGVAPLERRIRYLLIRIYQKTGNAAMAEKHRAIFESLPMTLVR